RIKRSVLDLQQVFRRSLDVLGDLVTVSRSKQERAQNQHVQRSLQQFDTVRGFFRHALVDILPGSRSHWVDVLPSAWLGSIRRPYPSGSGEANSTDFAIRRNGRDSSSRASRIGNSRLALPIASPDRCLETGCRKCVSKWSSNACLQRAACIGLSV